RRTRLTVVLVRTAVDLLHLYARRSEVSTFFRPIEEGWISAPQENRIVDCDRQLTVGWRNELCDIQIWIDDGRGELERHEGRAAPSRRSFHSRERSKPWLRHRPAQHESWQAKPWIQFLGGEAER